MKTDGRNTLNTAVLFFGSRAIPPNGMQNDQAANFYIVADPVDLIVIT